MADEPLLVPAVKEGNAPVPDVGAPVAALLWVQANVVKGTLDTKEIAVLVRVGQIERSAVGVSTGSGSTSTLT